MTTIAYRDGVIVADTWETHESFAAGTRRHTCCKLFRKTVNDKPVILGTAGGSYGGMLFVDWYGSGKEPNEFFYHMDLDEDFDVLILDQTGLYVSNRFCRPIKIEEKFYAVGSGSKAALAAMIMGASALKAVQIAVKLDPYTGGKLVSMSLDEGKLVKPKKKVVKVAHTDNLLLHSGGDSGK